MPVARQATVTEVPGLDAILNGDRRKGWERFYNNYRTAITNMVTKSGIVRTLEGGVESEEVAHDILSGLLRNESASLKGLTETTDAGVKAYFRTAVRNRHARLIREKVQRRKLLGEPTPTTDEKGQETVTEDDVAGWYARSRNPDPYELVSFKELVHQLHEVLDAMPPKHARIVRMLIQGMNQPEIAEALDVNLSSVGTRVNRAKAAAKEFIKVVNPELHAVFFSKTG